MLACHIFSSTTSSRVFKSFYFMVKYIVFFSRLTIDTVQLTRSLGLSKFQKHLRLRPDCRATIFSVFIVLSKKKVFEPQLVSQIHRLITTQPFKPNLRGFKASSQFKANILSLRCEKISERGKNPPRRLSILAREMYQQMRMRKYI